MTEVESLKAALAAARRECEGLRDRVREVRADMTPTNMQYEAPYLRQWIVSWARKLDAALAAPAAGEEGKRQCGWSGYTDNNLAGRCVLTEGHACPHQLEPTTGEEES